MLSSRFYPTNIEDFDYFNDKNSCYNKLYHSLSCIENLPNIIYFGPAGSGKKLEY